MRINSVLSFLRNSKLTLYMKSRVTFSVLNCNNGAHRKWLSISTARKIRMDRDEDVSDNEGDAEYDYLKTYDGHNEGFARDLLYKNSKDFLINRIYNCVSLQELFDVLNNNINYYKCEHITQTVLVLWDLKQIYQDINSLRTINSKLTSEEFFKTLKTSDYFQKLLELVEEKIENFDDNTLSYLLLYLNKLGLEIETPLQQLIFCKLESKLLKKFSISPASRLIETVFKEVHLKSYFMSQNLIPFIFNEIDSCESVQVLNDLTISLNKLHNVVTEEILNKYKLRVKKFIENGSISHEDYKVILQIISLLNYPKWRDKNSVLISKCILLLKDNLSNLTVNEITLLYEVFFKIQEPAEILSELQRCASKYLHELDGTITAQKITLFSIIIFFSSPHLRYNYQKILKKYVNECDDYDNLILLRKALSFIKISDHELCQLFWNKILKHLKNNSENIDILKLSQNYINFTFDIENYRHHKFENEILKLLENFAERTSYKFFPQKLALILSFVLIFGKESAFLQYLVSNLEDNWTQLGQVECLKLSRSLRVLREMDSQYIKMPYAQRIDKILNKIIRKEASSDPDLWKNDVLLKSCVFKNNVDPTLLNGLLLNHRYFKHLSSKNIESISFCFLVNNTLIPEVLEKVVEYIVTYEDHMLGFNMGKFLYLCYWLGYNPKSSFKFFEIVANTIIRDQERMTGLAIINCALALCFFNKLPNSLIKTIFNVEFMDKLDHELKICYSKDKYPQRVRNNLMQLNRAVCLDYPECNVPWFHQKYIEERAKMAKSKHGSVFGPKIKEYLSRIVENQNCINENVVAPYGYDIDFVINNNDESDSSKKLAVVLVPEFGYTRIFVQLKGFYQLKTRHLEMLEYKVILINYRDWLSLFHPKEKLDFLRNLILPKNSENLNKINSS